ncbi:MAG: biotin/lipoyl-binding protein, partial [Chlorobiaceae bacterium]
MEQPESKTMAKKNTPGKETPKAPNLMRMVMIGALLAVALIWGGSKLYHSFLYVETDNAQIVGDIYPVISRIPGRVEAVPASDNQKVKQGDTLITIDPADYRIKRDMAEAALQNARASVSAAGATASAAAATERKLS